MVKLKLEGITQNQERDSLKQDESREIGQSLMEGLGTINSILFYYLGDEILKTFFIVLYAFMMHRKKIFEEWQQTRSAITKTDNNQNRVDSAAWGMK